MVTCCEHNQCPQRPKWFLRKYRKQMWVCPECGLAWMTTQVVYWGEERTWKWKQVGFTSIEDKE